MCSMQVIHKSYTLYIQRVGAFDTLNKKLIRSVCLTAKHALSHTVKEHVQPRVVSQLEFHFDF